jgi:YHS domain-containing protein
MGPRDRPGFGARWDEDRLALRRRTEKKEEALDLQTLLHSWSWASVAAVVVLAANNTVGSSDKQTWDPAQNNAGSEPILVAQNAAAREAKASETARVNVDSKGVILKGYDAVAFFRQGKPVKGHPGIESTYQGATYLFASIADKADFDKDPAKYVPQYGGFCAYGVANGITTGTSDPDAFAVYNGKLYICGNQAALKSFKSNIDSNIDKADTNWRQLTGS